MNGTANEIDLAMRNIAPNLATIECIESPLGRAKALRHLASAVVGLCEEWIAVHREDGLVTQTP